MTRPLCKCHDKPMHKNSTSNGGWRCAVRNLERGNRRWKADVADRRMLRSLSNRHGCEVCGSRENLHRHHPNPNTKRFSIGRSIGGWDSRADIRVNFDLFYDELMNHTICLCPRCHTFEHIALRCVTPTPYPLHDETPVAYHPRETPDPPSRPRNDTHSRPHI